MSGAAGEGVVDVVMDDIRFEPQEVTVSVGQTVEFRFVNRGRLMHEAFIGSPAEQAAHEDMMATMSGMVPSDTTDPHHGHSSEPAATGHEDPHAGHMSATVTLAPGDAGSFQYTFDEPGVVEIGCHQPGHYTAGMKVTITVMP